MKKRSTYRPKPVSSPILVERSVCADEIEMHERMLVQAFTCGWATTHHYDRLANMRNVMVLAAHYKKDVPAIKVCETLSIVLANMRDHHAATGKIEASGDELSMICLFADAYRSFWKRQNMNLFKAACMEANIQLNDAKEAA